MIRAIGNTPAPTQTPAPAPKPVPEGGEQAGGQNLAFKGIAIKNIRNNKVTVNDFFEFLNAGKSKRVFKGGSDRSRLANDNVYTWDISQPFEVVKGRTKEAEDVLYKDLVAHKDMLPGVEIHKIDDWA